MRKLALIIFILLNGQTSFGQFVPSLFPNKLFYMPTVAFLKSNPQKIVGSDGFIIVKSTDGGKFFEILRDPIPGCVKLQFLNDTSILILDRKRFIYSNNNGNTWVDKYVVNNLGDTFIKESLLINYNIDDTGKGFVLAFRNRNKLNLSSYLTNDFGDTWELSDTNNINITDYNSSTSFSSKMYSFDSISYLRKEITKSVILIIKKNGVNISEVDFEAKTGGAKIWNFAFKDALTGMFLTQNNEAYITKDGCVSFTKVSNLPSKCTIIDYAKSTSSKSGFWAIFNNTSNISYYSLNDGIIWKTMENFNSINNVDFFNAEIGIASSVNANNRIMYFEGLPTSIYEITKQNGKVSIFPNPATTQLNITSNRGIKGILVYNVTGQLVKEFNYNNNLKDVSLAIDDLAQGMYLLQIIDELDAKVTSKFIKE